MIRRFYDICHTKCVLKTRAAIWIYVGGNKPFSLSANTSFFGVNIASVRVNPNPSTEIDLL